jgi:peptidoglycan/xylan/chitin deacetylase (PgdA/CDA1 family)
MADGGPIITFDDGGAGALMAADALERHGLKGRFFVTADYIGAPGFLDATGIRELSRRGHTIGSHSCSHPLKMASCGAARLDAEWTRSRDVLFAIVGEPILTGSIPGGEYSAEVARAAARAGYTELFTSEPVTEIRTLAGLTLRGRYTVYRWTRAGTAAAVARGDWTPRAVQAALWNMKKIFKRAGGNTYLEIRRLLLRHGREVRWGDGPAIE